MQYSLIDLLQEDHIIIGLEASNAKQVIESLNQVLVKSQHTTAKFAEDVWEREQRFPTGLPTQPVAVAIPHADPDHVLSSAVSLGVLAKPVKFAQMGTDDNTQLKISIVILLAIKEVEKQVEVIQQLMLLIQSPDLLKNLLKASNRHEALCLIQRELERE